MGNWLMDCGEFQCVVTSALPEIAHLPEVKLHQPLSHTHSRTRVLWGNTQVSIRAVFRCIFASFLGLICPIAVSENMTDVLP